MNKFRHERFENVAGSVSLKLACVDVSTFSILHIPLQGSLKDRGKNIKNNLTKTISRKILCLRMNNGDNIMLRIFHRSIIIILNQVGPKEIICIIHLKLSVNVCIILMNRFLKRRNISG